ncbi:hypothetical protein L6452_36985 [Arctium lappa]|uniref:Uncharacterized protein n=1 Tax=Arctium lappa TaxID=4217 RepID=A0ACB8Y2W9_ARCLA|nr:hypothetical protein L6452_36985 [Arctium lappa]
MYLTEKKRRMDLLFYVGKKSLMGYRSNDGTQSISAPVSSPPDQAESFCARKRGYSGEINNGNAIHEGITPNSPQDSIRSTLAALLAKSLEEWVSEQK